MSGPKPGPSSSSVEQTIQGPRIVTIPRIGKGFGFSVRGYMEAGGVMKSIHGEMYGPMQYISALDQNGIARAAGLRMSDHIAEVNGECVEGATHRQVVDLIKSCSENLILTVIAVPQPEVSPSENSDDSSEALYDYTERRAMGLTIPDYKSVQHGSAKYVVYNIYMSGRFLGCKRYREFVDLNTQLRRLFPDFSFPKLPGKWPFTMSDQQLDTRRRGLEGYLDKVCTVRVIGESDLMQEFLAMEEEEEDDNQAQVSDEEEGQKQVELKIILPDHTLCTVAMTPDCPAVECYDLIARKMKLPDSVANCFALFTTVAHGKYYRKLKTDELPHKIFLENYDKLAPSSILVKRWIFNVETERRIENHDLTLTFLFHEATEMVNNGVIDLEDHMYTFKALKDEAMQDKGKQLEYLTKARLLNGYGDVVFPHCKSSARKEGSVVVAIGYENLKLHACTDEGKLESQVIEINWSTILDYQINKENNTFVFQYEREGKKPRAITVHTNMFMLDCCEQVSMERNTVHRANGK